MSDKAQILAFRIEGLEARDRSAEVLAWLVERGIVEALPTNSGLGSLAHRPGAKVLDAVVSPPDPSAYFDFRKGATNGMEVHSSIRAKLAMGLDDEMPVFGCPKCKAEIDADDVLPLVEEIENPFEGVPEVKCPKCKKANAVDALSVEGGAFANLTLRFWNWWPLKESFVEEVSARCGAPAVVLYERL